MPAGNPAPAVRIERAGGTLRFAGALLRPQVAAAWRRSLPLLGTGDAGPVTAFDLGGLERVDSAGVALLAELAARCGDAVVIDTGDGAGPAGLAELRAAYRLTPALRFAT